MIDVAGRQVIGSGSLRQTAAVALRQGVQWFAWLAERRLVGKHLGQRLPAASLEVSVAELAAIEQPQHELIHERAKFFQDIEHQ